MSRSFDHMSGAMRPNLSSRSRGNRRSNDRSSAGSTFGDVQSQSIPRSVCFNTVAPRPFAPRPLNPTITVLLAESGLAFTTNAIAPSFFGYAPTLSSFAQASEYIGLFDQYKILRLEVWLEPVLDASTAQYPLLSSCIDYDDGNTPTSMPQVEAKQNSLTANGAAAQYHCWRPRVATAAYSGVFSSFANVPAPWFDSASPGVVHFGFKAAAGASPVALTYYLTTRALVSFRQPGI